MKIQMNKFKLGALVVAGSIALFSCNDEWDDHYSEVSSSVSGVSIWETLNSNSEFSEFTKVLKEYGYEEKLSGVNTPRIYTVFAPTNEAMRSYTEEGNVDDEFIKNHISYFYQNISSFSDTTVTMLNDKVMRMRNNLFGDKANPIYPVEYRNIACQNGLLQGIGGIVPYKKNIWEYLGDLGGPMKDYLYSFNRIELNVSESTPGPIDSSGQTVFLDSVTYLYNSLWYTYTGELNNEDSTYVTFLLDDQGWAEGYAKVEKSYEYNDAQAPYFEEGIDSLHRMREAYIMHAMMRDISFRKSVFDKAMNNEDIDQTLIKSTARRSTGVPASVVKEWRDLIPEEDVLDASNGVAYRTSTFYYDAADSWQDTIKVEGESTYRLFEVGSRQTYAYPSLVTDTLTISPLSSEYDPTATNKHEVSGGSYIYVQRSAALTAAATFGIANTQSGKYDLWITFIPASMVPGVTPLPMSVNVTVSYAYLRGTSINSRADNTYNFEIDPYAVTRVKVEVPDLEICYEDFLGSTEYLYTDENSKSATNLLARKYGLSVFIKNAAGLLEGGVKDQNLYIDCLELVPRREN